MPTVIYLSQQAAVLQQAREPNTTSSVPPRSLEEAACCSSAHQTWCCGRCCCTWTYAGRNLSGQSPSFSCKGEQAGYKNMFEKTHFFSFSSCMRDFWSHYFVWCKSLSVRSLGEWRWKELIPPVGFTCCLPATPTASANTIKRWEVPLEGLYVSHLILLSSHFWLPTTPGM